MPYLINLALNEPFYFELHCFCNRAKKYTKIRIKFYIIPETCFETNSTRRRVLASSCYPAFFRGHRRVGTPSYLSMMRLRKIWAEGSFSVLKREHCLSKIRKRGIPAVTEECLLSVMALNLKRMVKASFFQLSPPLIDVSC